MISSALHWTVFVLAVVAVVSAAGLEMSAEGPVKGGKVAQKTYRVGLSQYYDSKASLMQNVDALATDIKAAVAEKADLAIVPEFSLFMPKTKQQTAGFCKHNDFAVDSVPCDSKTVTESALGLISCLAKKENIYVMVNYVDCPGDKVYNTNFVFERGTGKLVQKYHKLNVYLKKVFDTPPKPNHVTWKASFGQTFGMFMCKDILYTAPSVELRKQGIKAFSYNAQIPIPGVSALAFKAWSYIHDAVLIASNPNQFHASGGVWYKGKKLSREVGKILVADVPVWN